ncbi:MAG: DUF805 domain-containing protein [Pirellulales bacterium]
MGKITFSCTQCDKLYSVDRKYAGKFLKCKCGHKLAVPHQQTRPDAAEEAHDLGAPDPILNASATNQPGASMFCTKCGAQVPPNSGFCSSCGNRMGSSAVSRQQAPMVANASTMDLPWYEWFFYNVRYRFANSQGRARRKEYWYSYLVSVLIGFGLAIVEGALGLFPTVDDSVLQSIFNLATAIPMVCVSIRRLHDVGKSGWNLLWSLTIIGIFYVLILLVRDSSPGANEYGPNPKGL